MVDNRVIDIWRQHPSFLDCYALVWNPLSKYEPLSILPLLSSEFDFIPKEMIHKSWNVSQIIYGLYHENVIIAIDYFLDSIFRKDPLEMMIEAAHSTMNQLDLVIEDLKTAKSDLMNSSILEMAIEIKKISQLWIERKQKKTLNSDQKLNKADELSFKTKDSSKLNPKIETKTTLKMEEEEDENDKEKMIDRMQARMTRQKEKSLWSSQDMQNTLKGKDWNSILENLKVIQKVNKKLKSQFRYNLDKNLNNYNIFSFQNLLVKNHKNYNNLLKDRIYQEIQKWNVLEHKRKLYNNLKTNRIYKENLNIHIIDYIIINIYKNKKTRRNMSYDLRKESFRNLIDPKKSDNDARKKNEELNSYRVQLLHISRFGNKEQLDQMMKDKLFLELNEDEKLKYAEILKKKI